MYREEIRRIFFNAIFSFILRVNIYIDWLTNKIMSSSSFRFMKPFLRLTAYKKLLLIGGLDALDLTGLAVKLIANQLAGDVPNGKCRLKLSRRLGAYCRPWEGNMRISPSVTWGGCSSAKTIVRATSSASKTAGKRS